MRESHRLDDVFTPSSVAKLTFVEREALRDRVVKALSTKGKQLVIFGRSGCGKSTLLENKLEQLYEHHITTQCTRGMKMGDLLLDAFDQIRPFYRESFKDTKSAAYSAKLTQLGPFAELSGTNATGSEEVSKRVLPPQLNGRFLAELLHDLKACWVVDDFHKVADDAKVELAGLMKLFVNLSTDFPDVRIVAVGAVGSAREIIHAEQEMWHRITELEVPLMTEEEIDALLTKGEELLNVRFGGTIRSDIKHFSNGLAAVAHQLCFNMCFAAHLTQTADELVVFQNPDFAQALQEWIDDNSDTLQDTYDSASRAGRERRFDNRRLIIHAVATFPPRGATHAELLEAIRRNEPDYPPGNLTQYLSIVCANDGILCRDKASGRVFFGSPLMHAYVRAISKRAAQEQEKLVRMPEFWTVFSPETTLILQEIVHLKGREDVYFIPRVMGDETKSPEKGEEAVPESSK